MVARPLAIFIRIVLYPLCLLISTLYIPMADKELKADLPVLVVGPGEAVNASLGYAETGSDNAGLRETFGWVLAAPCGR